MWPPPCLFLEQTRPRTEPDIFRHRSRRVQWFASVLAVLYHCGHTVVSSILTIAIAQQWRCGQTGLSLGVKSPCRVHPRFPQPPPLPWLQPPSSCTHLVWQRGATRASWFTSPTGLTGATPSEIPAKVSEHIQPANGPMVSYARLRNQVFRTQSQS